MSPPPKSSTRESPATEQLEKDLGKGGVANYDPAEHPPVVKRRSLVTLPSHGTATLTSGNDQAAPLDKRPGLQGGLSDLIATPFAIVVGTSSADPEMNRLC